MKHTSKVVLITRSINRLLGASKPNITRLNHKDEYYRCYWFPKNLCDGIEIVSQIERVNKKNAAVQLMKAGLSSYMGGKLTEQIKLDAAARELDEKAKSTRFAFILRKVARANGMDISKFI